MKIAQISDLHFSHPTFAPSQLFSKRWIGNLNLLFSRRKEFETASLFHLVELFKKEGVDHIVITGDLTTTSFDKEFEAASQLVEQFKQAKIQVFALPGNHDQYTKSAYRKQLFYQFFPSCLGEKEGHPLEKFDLKKDKIAIKSLSPGWWLILLDTAVATSLISSRGLFSSECEVSLEKALQSIPKDQHIILCNHFPFFDHESPRKTLVGSSRLKALIQRFKNIKMYLHGHTHRHCLADLRGNGYPIILDSGSTSHLEIGAWNLIEISPKDCKIQVFRYSLSGWHPAHQASFIW